MIIFLLFVSVFVTILTFSWGIHISQVRDYTRQSGWAGYKQFKREFDKADWGHNKAFSFSLFEKGTFNQTECHASIIQFDTRGMMIHNPFSYLLVQLYVFKYIRKHFKTKKPKRQKIKW